MAVERPASDAAHLHESHEKKLTTPIKLCSDPNCALPEGHTKPFHVPLYVLLQEAGYVKGPWAR